MIHIEDNNHPCSDRHEPTGLAATGRINAALLKLCIRRNCTIKTDRATFGINLISSCGATLGIDLTGTDRTHADLCRDVDQLVAAILGRLSNLIKRHNTINYTCPAATEISHAGALSVSCGSLINGRNHCLRNKIIANQGLITAAISITSVRIELRIADQV
jgi:hypothetical protein